MNKPPVPLKPLSTTEREALARLRAKIDAIVALGTPQALLATGVLGDTPAGSADLLTFHRRFQLLGPQLGSIGSPAGYVTVRDDLPDATGAATVLTLGAPPQLLRLEVGPELLGPATPILTYQALTLVHELTHTMNDIGSFPVKDYAYRTGWAWNYLPVKLAVDNADSYAAAAAALAEQLERKPGRYQEAGSVPAQARALHAFAQQCNLGPALAWADFVVNRAWVRSMDSAAFAGETVANGDWASTRTAWGKDPDRAGLLAIEQQLLQLGVLAYDRHSGPLTTGLSTADVAAVRQVLTWTTGLKHTLNGIEPVLVAVGREISYDPATRRLTVPFAVIALAPADLGRLVLKAVVGEGVKTGRSATTGVAKPGTDVRARTDRDCSILGLLVKHDRPAEHEALAPVLAELAGRPLRPVGGPDWEKIQTALKWAVLKEISSRWTVMAAQVEDRAELPAAERTALATIDDGLATDLARLTADATWFKGPDAARQFDAMGLALAEMGAVVARFHRERGERYQALRLKLDALRN
ncbi:hypothetical protein ACFW1A_35840 [Kitasatospora sp. NPDC058965]|uniref:hypothetical protein n=1 Tax=Kitasatospora sp. NPDC058965 TaxID=3346682 RepID=UPI0036993D01